MGLILLVVLASGCSKAPEGIKTIDGEVVSISGFAFNPQETSTNVGTQVVWKQADDAPHDVVSDGFFKSKTLSKGEEFSFTFDKPGEYDYYCSIHPRMKGRVVVS